jgi:hypothetical protein
MGKDFTPAVSIETHYLRYRTSYSESAADDRTCAGSGDEVKTFAEVKRHFIATPRKKRNQSV